MHILSFETDEGMKRIEDMSRDQLLSAIKYLHKMLTEQKARFDELYMISAK